MSWNFLSKNSSEKRAGEGTSRAMASMDYGHVEWFEGNYEDYEADKKCRLGDDAPEPHRIEYKPLTR